MPDRLNDIHDIEPHYAALVRAIVAIGIELGPLHPAVAEAEAALGEIDKIMSARKEAERRRGGG